jgi:hypothetical protein
MINQVPLNKKLTSVLAVISCSFGLFTITIIPKIIPTLAHTVEVSGNVAATFHLEPNHNPKAGETAQVWFALTRKGGEIIPLSKCQCQLSIYAKPRSQTDQPLMTPELEAISAEKYQGIPGTNIIFPATGQYELELVGTPKESNDFQPFNFTYSVTVR